MNTGNNVVGIGKVEGYAYSLLSVLEAVGSESDLVEIIGLVVQHVALLFVPRSAAERSGAGQINIYIYIGNVLSR